MINDWWSNRYGEKYWLEVTGRSDLGVNLKAPQTNEQGNEFWSYSLLKFVQPDDIVFHYSRTQQAVVARSIITGSIWEDQVVWAARGTSARAANIHPHTRPGWYVGLEQYMLLNQSVTLDTIRNAQAELLAQRNQLLRQVKEPLYFPFEMSTKRPLRPMQGYLFKLPLFFVACFPQLKQSGPAKVIKEGYGRLGDAYRIADENTSIGQYNPFSIDPTLVERSLQGHATTQNALASYLRERNLEPRSPTTNEPNFDLAWVHNSEIWVAEIKSITARNEEKQLRLGLGQLLRYRQLLSSKGSIRAVLAVEHQPMDLSWENLCESLNVLLVWPSNWKEKLPL